MIWSALRSLMTDEEKVVSSTENSPVKLSSKSRKSSATECLSSQGTYKDAEIRSDIGDLGGEACTSEGIEAAKTKAQGMFT